MQNYRVPLLELPPEGRQFQLADAAIWQSPLEEFGMDCRIVQPLRAEIQLIPTEGGCLIRGHLSGQVALPCNRCAEEALTSIDASFEDFEELPDAAQDRPPHLLQDSESQALHGTERLVLEGASPMLDLAAVCWEEFMLALPVSPLCKTDCKGLCPRCGVNRNQSSCNCSEDEGDPRLAVLRGLKLPRQ